MKILVLLLLLLSAQGAEVPVQWEKLRTMTRPTGRASLRRPEAPLLVQLLDQAARRLEAQQSAAAELEAIRRLSAAAGSDPVFSGSLMRLKQDTLSAADLREAAAAVTRASAEAYGPPPSSTIAVERVPLVNRSMAPAMEAARQDQHLAGELDADKVVLLSPEVRAQAAELGNDPARIFAFVHNNIELEWHPGAMQNSLAVLWSRRAGAVDQATLLIALLRAAGIPARYVFGSIRLTETLLMDWTGTKTPAAAIYFARQALPVEVTVEGVTLDHVWVEASIGDNWVALDPSFKTRRYQPGIVIPQPAFRREEFLQKVTAFTAGEAYLDQIREYLRGNLPGVSLSDLSYSGPIIQVPGDALPASYPYSVTRTVRRITGLEPDDMHRIVVTLSAAGGTAMYFTKELFLPEVCLNSLTISSSANGGAASPRNGTTTYKPSLYADDSVIAESNSAFVNTFLTLRVQYFPVGGAVVDSQRIIQPGQLLGIPFSAFHGSQYLNYRINRLLSSNFRTGDAGPAIRDILNITGIRYLQRLTETRRSLGAPLQLAPVNVRALYGFTYGVPGLIAGRPVMTPNNLGMDMTGAGRIPIVDLNSGDSATSELRSFRQTLGLTASGLEHQTCEEIALMTSASTTKVFQVASQLGIPLVSITPENAAALIPDLEYTGAEKNQLVGRLFAGSVLILVPKRPVPVGDFRFFAYVAEDDLGFGLYVINGAAGGTVVDPRSGPPSRSGSSGSPRNGGRTVGDPVNVANGNMYLEAIDLDVAARGFPIQLVRSYNNQSAVVGPFGLGWTHNYNMSIRVLTNSIEVTDDTGGVYALTRSGSDFVTTLDLGWRITPDGTDYVMRNRTGFQWKFGSGGRLRSMTDTNGNQASFTYDAAGRLTTATDAAGRQFAFSYDARNRITAVQDPTGRRVSYTYDAGDHLVSFTNVAGNRTSYTYETGAVADQNLNSITDAEGNISKFVYYADDKVFKTVNPAGGEMVMFYLPYQQTTLSVDERGFARTYQYDAAGRVVRVTDPEGNVIATTYDANGLPVEQTDPGGSMMRLEYDARGNNTRITDPLGAVWSFEYEPLLNRLTSTVDPRGNVTRAQYDSRGNLTKWTGPSGAVRTYVYDASGNLTGRTDELGNSTSIAYDSNGQWITHKDAMGNQERIERDSLSRPVRGTNALGESTTSDYDAAGNTTRVASPLGYASSFAYDGTGRLTQVTSPKQNVRRYTYDSADQMKSATFPSGESVQYDIPASLPLTTMRNARGATWEITYNHRGQPLETRNPLGDVAREGYDGRGNRVERRFPDGATVRMTYDLANRLTERRLTEDASDRYSYDAAGNLITASNANVTYQFTYDERNLVTGILDSRFPAPILFAYDSVGRRVRRTDPEGRATEYIYDARGLLSSIRNPAGLTTRYRYDAAGRVVGIDFANGTNASYQWDSGGRMLSIAYSAGATVRERVTYEYDQEGNRVSMTDASGRHQYVYDASARLTRATHPDQPEEQYSYDAAGNRTASHRDASLTYDAADRLTGAAGFAYDRRGNVVARSGQTLSYDNLRRLTGVVSQSGAVSYSYDPFGRRIAKNVNGQVTQYVYDGDQILAEYSGDGRLTARYTHGVGNDIPLIMERDLDSSGSFESGELYFYQADGLGSIRALADSAGEVVERYRYDAFGNLAQGTAGAAGNPFLFTAREWDAEIGLYYYRARHYDPAYGRFLQADALWNLSSPDTLNRYTYVGNNPVNFVDPGGHSSAPGDRAGGGGSVGASGSDRGFGSLDQELDEIQGLVNSPRSADQLRAQIQMIRFQSEFEALVQKLDPVTASTAQAIWQAQTQKLSYDSWMQQAAQQYYDLASHARPVPAGIRHLADFENVTRPVEAPVIRIQDSEPFAQRRPDGTVHLSFPPGRTWFGTRPSASQ